MSYDVEEILNDEEVEPYIERFRNHYQRHYNSEAQKYYDILPAYYHGFVVASAGNTAAATQLWEDVTDAVQHAWSNKQSIQITC